jgi:hypothetical protein
MFTTLRITAFNYALLKEHFLSLVERDTRRIVARAPTRLSLSFDFLLFQSGTFDAIPDLVDHTAYKATCQDAHRGADH